MKKQAGASRRHRPHRRRPQEARRESSRRRCGKCSGKEFPDDPLEQLWGGIGAVFKSPGTASAPSPTAASKASRTTGAPPSTCRPWSSATWATPPPPAWPSPATRPPARTSSTASGSSTPRARTWWPASARPNPLNEDTKNEQNKHLPSLENAMPESTSSSTRSAASSRSTTRDMQDIEFTIQEGKLWMLQCRVGKRTGTAALNMAMDMLDEKLIDEKTAVMRVEPAQLDELLHPIVDPAAEKKAEADRQGSAGRPGRRVRQDRLHRGRRGGLGQDGREGDPRARRDQPGGRRGHARGGGHSHRPRRHDQPRGARRPRLGQVLHRRRRRR